MMAVMTAMILAAAFQPAEDWQEVTRTDRGTLSADIASKSRAGDIVTLRTRTQLAEALPDGTASIVARMRYNCRRNQSETMAVTMIGADCAEILASEIPDDQRQMEPVVPDSPDALLAAFACR